MEILCEWSLCRDINRVPVLKWALKIWSTNLFPPTHLLLKLKRKMYVKPYSPSILPLPSKRNTVIRFCRLSLRPYSSAFSLTTDNYNGHVIATTRGEKIYTPRWFFEVAFTNKQTNKALYRHPPLPLPPLQLLHPPELCCSLSFSLSSSK